MAKRRGGPDRNQSGAFSAKGVSSGPTSASRLMSYTTRAWPSFASRENITSISARAVIVASMIDWNAIVRANPFTPSPLSSAANRAARTPVIRCAWSPAFTANDTYLYGSYSGPIAFHASFSMPGRRASRDCHTAAAAAGLTPIAGEKSTRRSIRGRSSPPRGASSCSTASAPLFE